MITPNDRIICSCEFPVSNRRYKSHCHPFAIKLLLCGFYMAWALVGSEARGQTLPSPTGVSPVGRTRFHWVDAKRSEVLDLDAKAQRELNVEVWYPAQRGRTGATADYIPY